jgi:TolA-binding protein
MKLFRVLSLLTLALFVHAEETKDVKAYLEQLQMKLDHAAQRANQPTSGTSNTVGVRGAPQQPMSKQLYWKGKKGAATPAPEEIRQFRAAIEQARAGQTAEAVAALKLFTEKYPKSPLLADAQETLRVLGTL